MKVTAKVMNENTNSQYYILWNIEEGFVIHYAPNNWKTKKGAENWAKKHGFTVA